MVRKKRKDDKEEEGKEEGGENKRTMRNKSYKVRNVRKKMKVKKKENVRNKS